MFSSLGIEAFTFEILPALDLDLEHKSLRSSERHNYGIKGQSRATFVLCLYNSM